MRYGRPERAGAKLAAHPAGWLLHAPPGLVPHLSYPRMTLCPAFISRLLQGLFLAALLAVCSTGHAEQHPPVHVGFTGYNHTAWRAGQGAPGDIWDIQQDEAGTLWLATGSGLYTFDGQRFQRQEAGAGADAPSLNMITLFADRPGSMWIGYFHAGIGHLANGRTLKSYQRSEGVPAGVVSSFAYDNDGVLWAAVEQGLRRFRNGRWEKLPASMGVPERRGHWLLNDSRGTFWALVGQQVWYIPKGGSTFIPTGIGVAQMSTLAESPSGEIWLADRGRGTLPIADAHGMLPEAEREARRLPGIIASRMHFTADGVMWAPMRGIDGVGGAARVIFNGKTAVSVETFNVAQGLTSPAAVPVFEDREGNIWIGTNLGLSRFRAQSVRTLTEGPYDPYRIIGRNSAGDLFGYGESTVPYALQRQTLDLPRAGLQAAGLANRTPLWQFEWTNLVQRRGHELQRIAFPGAAEGLQPQALYFPSAREAWACVQGTFLSHYLDGAWRSPVDLQRNNCIALAPDGKGGLIAGFADGALALYNNGQLHALGKADGLNIGPITSILAQGDLLLVAGEKGLAIRRGANPFGEVKIDIAGALEGITGIVVDPSRQLWLNGGRGLVRLDLATAIESATHGSVVSPRLFDDVDGMPGVALQSGPLPTAQLSRDGLLWLGTNQGLAWLDTRKPNRSRAAPVTSIGNIHYGDAQEPLANGATLPAGITQLQIDFIAQSLARPERNRYRYRLSRVDADWRDAGSATTAYYTNLGPGTYTFDVIAASEDGVWGTAPTSASFTIEPLLTQTFWFRSLVAIAIILLIAAAARMRARNITALVKARYEERLQERERIARDLHDTLLQGSQGLLLRLHAISVMPALPPGAQERLESAMQAAEDSLREGRDRVTALRQEADNRADLAAALSEVFSQDTQPDDRRLRITVEGEPPRIGTDALEEIYLIGREAIRNAIEHSGASAIEVEIAYGATLRLHIRDDGQGMEPDRVREGHWGLQGMRERALRLGADLKIWSRPGLGTEVALSIPTHRLNPARATAPWWRRLPWPRS